MLGLVRRLCKTSSTDDRLGRLPGMSAEDIAMAAGPVPQHQEHGEQPGELSEHTEEHSAMSDPEEQQEEPEVTAIPGWHASMTLDVLDLFEVGEEYEEEMFAERATLFHFIKGEWKNFGVGDAKLLRHKETGDVRFIHRQEKTFKMLANHYVKQQALYCIPNANPSSQRSWAWTALDCAGCMPQVHQIGLKLASPEIALEFQRLFDDAKELKPRGPVTSDDKGLQKRFLAKGSDGQPHGTSLSPRKVARRFPAGSAPQGPWVRHCPA